LNDDVRRNILIIHLLMWHKLHGEDLCLQWRNARWRPSTGEDDVSMGFLRKCEVQCLNTTVQGNDFDFPDSSQSAVVI
jgi:hypothetical protein